MGIWALVSKFCLNVAQDFYARTSSVAWLRQQGRQMFGRATRTPANEVQMHQVNWSEAVARIRERMQKVMQKAQLAAGSQGTQQRTRHPCLRRS